MAFSSTLSAGTPSATSGSHGVDDLGPAAVVEGHGEGHAPVVLGQLDRLVHAPQHPLGHPPVAAAGEADPHALLVAARRGAA